MLFSEWKNLLKNKFLIIVLVAILAIPSIYAVTFLVSVWDTYGKVDNLPVAVVNHDQAVKYHGKTINIGNDLEKNLKDSSALDFRFPSQKSADDGLKNGKYYMVLEMPNNMSKSATTVMDKHPQKMTITYKTSSGHSFIASKMTSSAAEKITQKISDNVSKLYAKTLLNQMQQMGMGMSTAATANGKLSNGTKSIQSGTDQIAHNLDKLSRSSLVFKDGANTLEKGLSQYTVGTQKLSQGSQSLSAGLGKMDTQVPKLSQGMQQLSQGSNSLTNGIAAYTNGVSSVDSGAQKLNQGMGQLSQNTSQLGQAVYQLNTGASQLVSGVQGYTGGTNKAFESSKQLSDALEQLNQTLNHQTPSTQSAALSRNLSDFQNGLSQLEKQLDESSQSQKSSSNITAMLTAINHDLTTLSNQAQQPAKQSDNAAIASKIDQVAKTQHLTAEQVTALKSTLSSSENTPTQQNTSTDAAIADAKQQISVLTSELNKSENTTPSTAVKVTIKDLNAKFGSANDANTLYGGIYQALENQGSLNDKVSQLSAGANHLSQGLAQLSQHSEALNNGATRIAGSLAVLDGKMPELVQGVRTLSNGSQSLAQGTQQLNSKGAKLQSGSAKVNTGLNQVNQQLPALSTGVHQLTTGSQQLTNGLGQLVDNGPKLTSGATKLATGADKLSQGSGQLASGAQKVTTAVGKVHDGNQTLHDKLSRAGHAVQQLNHGNQNDQQIAQPAKTKHVETDTVKNNGTAMAPYMMSVSLFVGAVSLNLMFDMYTPKQYPKNARQWFLSKMMILYPFAWAQATLEYILMVKCVGLEAVSYTNTYWMLVAISFALTTLVTSLNVLFGKIGSFFAMILMVLQLGGSGGTYPLELTNSFFTTISPYLPLTYAVNGLRQTLMIGNGMSPNIEILLLIFIAFSLLLWLFFRLQYKKLRPISFESAS